jgi:hypothetical protein
MSFCTFQCFLALAGGRVPDLDAVVVAAGRKEPAVRRKSHGVDGFAA